MGLKAEQVGKKLSARSKNMLGFLLRKVLKEGYDAFQTF